MGDADEEYEYVILNKREVFAYQIPPASSAQGHKADDWNKDYIWRGRIQIVGQGKNMAIKLLDSDNGKLFARCDIPNGEYDKFVSRTVDSSRYFVLKIANQGRHVFIGIGFAERNDAFDFNVGMTDFNTNSVREEESNQKNLIKAPEKDLSIKEGQKISVNLKGVGTGRREKQREQNANPSGFALAPPPPGGQSIGQKPATGGYSGGLVPHPPAPPASSPWGSSDFAQFSSDADFADFQSAEFQSAPAAPGPDNKDKVTNL